MAVLVTGLLFSAILLLPGSAQAATSWYVQFGDEGFDESAVRRAIALELRELDIPGDPLREGDTAEDVSLHVLLATEEGVLYVSLWDRGEFVGRKHVSRSQQPRILARRAGLAMSELGRWLSAKRRRVARRLQLEEQKRASDELERQRRAKLKALGVRAGLDALFITDGAWLLGPTIGLEFNGHFPLRLITQASWMAGSLPLLSGATLGETAPSWSQFEFGLGADYVHRRASGLELSVGGLIAASAVHVGGATEVDSISQQRDTWTARAGARFGTSKELTSGVRGRFDLTAGSLLRSIPLSRDGQRENLGGFFLGFALSASLTPRRADHGE